MCDEKIKVKGQSEKVKCIVKHDPRAKVRRHTAWLAGSYWYFWETKPKRKKAKSA